jgi:O-antigen ligase
MERTMAAAGLGRALPPAFIALTGGLLLWAPVPLGSNRPWSWSLLAVWAALLLAAWAAATLAAPAAMAPKRLRIPWAVAAAAAATVPVWAWALLQTVPAAVGPWLEPHPLWAGAAAAGLDSGVVPLVGLDAAGGRDALTRLVAYAAVFWTVFALAQEPARARLLLLVVVAATTACAAYGLLVHFAGWNTIGWVEKTAYVGDATGTFVNRNSFATYANLGLVACLALLAEPFLAARGLADVRRIAARAVEQVLDRRGLLVLASCVLAMASLQSHSRGGLLSAGLAVAALVFLLFLVTRPRPVLVAAVLAVTVGVGWGLLAVSGGATLERLGQVDASYDLQADARLSFWQVSLELAGERPWLGHGYGNFEAAFAQTRDERFNLVVDKAHNTYLEHLVELGVPATLLLYLGPALLFGWCLRGVFARRRDQVFPLAAVGATVLVALHSLVDFSLQIPAVAVTYAALLGIGAAQAAPSSARRPSRPGASLRD